MESHHVACTGVGVIHLMQETVSMEGMSTGEHVEALSQQSGVTYLTPGISSDGDTPEHEMVSVMSRGGGVTHLFLMS